MTYLSHEDRVAIQQGRLAAKRSRTSYPTARELLERPAAVRRREAFEDLNWAEDALRMLLSGGIDDKKARDLKTYIRTRCQKARRSAESAKHLGCALHRV